MASAGATEKKGIHRTTTTESEEMKIKTTTTTTTTTESVAITTIPTFKEVEFTTTEEGAE